MKKLFLAASLLAVLGCNDQPEQIPVYLKINSFSVSAPGGTSWQKVTEGWLYVEGDFLGAYSLPALVPVLAEGEREVTIFPGVLENGIEATPNIYPYLTRFIKKYTLNGGETMEVNPNTDYDANATFAFGLGRGDFDGGSFITLENRDSDAGLDVMLTEDGALAGKCILMQADTSHPIMDVATEVMMDIPVTGAPEVWLEMSYKTDVTFFLYLLSGPQQRSNAVFQFNTSEEWNKIYINLTPTLVQFQESQQRLFFRLSLPRSSPGVYTQNSGTVRIDNIRLVHY